MRNKLLIAMTTSVVMAGMAGCVSYSTNAPNATTVENPTFEMTESPGKWGVVLDQSLTQSMQIKPVGECWILGEKYDFTTADSLPQSVSQSLDSIFDQIVVLPAIPDPAAMQTQGLKGVVLVRMESITAESKCVKPKTDYWTFGEDLCFGTFNIALGADLVTPTGEKKAIRAESSKTGQSRYDGCGVWGSPQKALSVGFADTQKDVITKLLQQLTKLPELNR